MSIHTELTANRPTSGGTNGGGAANLKEIGLQGAGTSTGHNGQRVTQRLTLSRLHDQDTVTLAAHNLPTGVTAACGSRRVRRA